MPEGQQLSNTDHDLLVRLDTKVDGFIASQVDHETRLRVLEKLTEQENGSHKSKNSTWNWITVGILVTVGVAQTIIAFFVKQ